MSPIWLWLALAAAQDPPAAEPTAAEPTASEPTPAEPTPAEPTEPASAVTGKPAAGEDTATATEGEPAAPAPAPARPAPPNPLVFPFDPLLMGPVFDEPGLSPDSALMPSAAPPPAPADGLPMGPAPSIPAPRAAPPPPAAAPPTGPVPDLSALLPSIPERSMAAAFRLMLLALGLAGLGRALGGLRQRLLPEGLLPQALGTVKALARFGAVAAGLAALAALLPANLVPALPFVILGAAVATGWSLRELLPDVIAGVAVTLERPLKQGQWIAGDGFSGTVSHLGTRALWVTDREGRRVAVPWRRLLGAAVVDEPGRFPAVNVAVQLPVELDPRRARRLLREIALASPWVAPGEAPEVLADPHQAGTWQVRARLLEGRHAARFEASLVERARLACRASAAHPGAHP